MTTPDEPAADPRPDGAGAPGDAGVVPGAAASDGPGSAPAATVTSGERPAGPPDAPAVRIVGRPATGAGLPGHGMLSEQSREDTDAAWGDYQERDSDRLLRDRPPHWQD